MQVTSRSMQEKNSYSDATTIKNTTNELINQFKERKNLESDYSAAKALGLRPNRLSNYRTGISHADDKTAIMLADELGLDRLETIARINADRSTTTSDRNFWKRIAKAAIVAGVIFATTPATVRASAVFAAGNQCILCK